VTTESFSREGAFWLHLVVSLESNTSVCCSVLQCVSAWCSVLQRVAVTTKLSSREGTLRVSDKGLTESVVIKKRRMRMLTSAILY